MMPISFSTPPGEVGEHHGRRSSPCSSLRAAEVEGGLVDRQRLDQRVSACIIARFSQPTRAYFSMSGGVLIASGQASSCLNIGDGRTHAIDAGVVASGQNCAAFAAADDERRRSSAGIIAFLCGRVESVAVDMG